MSPLDAWDNFYVIVGSSGAALTGLQFVVIALVADARERADVDASTDTIDAFGTPNVVHFSAVLIISAVLSAPWRSLLGAAIAVGACGVAGVTYALIVTRRARRQTGYKPVLEDWIFHSALPFIAYGATCVGALTLPRYSELPLFVIGAATLLLLCVGIHNAWDTVTYIAITRAPQPADRGRDTPVKP